MTAAESLDRMFGALADPARRKMLERLSRGPATVSELKKPLSISLPAVMQHLRVLEESGLVSSRKEGRVRTCHMDPKALRSAEKWLEKRRSHWERTFDRLGAFLAEEQEDA